MAWRNPRWNSITDPDLRAVFLSLEDFLSDPTFDKGIQIGNGTQPTYDPATDLKTAQDLLRFGSDEMTAAMAGAPDGSPPSSSPAPTVLSALGALVVQWTRVSNADAVTYEVHLSTTSGFTPSGATKVAENTDGSQVFIRKTAAGAALAYGTTYYVKIVARDADGAATESAQAPGTIAQVTGPDIAARAIVAGSAIIDAAAIDAAMIGSVDAGTITAGFLDVTNRINANAIDASKIAALYIQVGKFIRSAGYVAGSSGWAIDGNGDAEFNNVIVRGTLGANTIAGWLTTGAGGGFRTAASGKRWELTSGATANTLKSYSGDSNETAPGFIEVDTNPVSIGTWLKLGAPTISGTAGPTVELVTGLGGTRYVTVDNIDRVDIKGNIYGPRDKTFIGALGSYGSYSTGGWSNFSTLTGTFKKLTTGSSILVTVSVSGYATATGPCAFGVRINGVDYEIARTYFNATGDHRTWGGATRVAATLTAGSYTVQPRIFIGTGTAITSDVNDCFSIVVEEVD